MVILDILYWLYILCTTKCTTNWYKKL